MHVARRLAGRVENVLQERVGARALAAADGDGIRELRLCEERQLVLLRVELVVVARLRIAHPGQDLQREDARLGAGPVVLAAGLAGGD